MWCLNSLHITGAADERFRLRTVIGDGVDLLARADPRCAGHGAAMSHAWCLGHWGCPGEARGVRHRALVRADRYTFSTPHAPPLAWCAVVAARFVDLELLLAWENIEDDSVGEARFAGGVRTAYREMPWIDECGGMPGHDDLVVPGETLLHP